MFTACQHSLRSQYIQKAAGWPARAVLAAGLLCFPGARIALPINLGNRGATQP